MKHPLKKRILITLFSFPNLSSGIKPLFINLIDLIFQCILIMFQYLQVILYKVLNLSKTVTKDIVNSITYTFTVRDKKLIYVNNLLVIEL